MQLAGYRFEENKDETIPRQIFKAARKFAADQLKSIEKRDLLTNAIIPSTEIQGSLRMLDWISRLFNIYVRVLVLQKTETSTELEEEKRQEERQRIEAGVRETLNKVKRQVLENMTRGLGNVPETSETTSEAATRQINQELAELEAQGENLPDIATNETAQAPDATAWIYIDDKDTC